MLSCMNVCIILYSFTYREMQCYHIDSMQLSQLLLTKTLLPNIFTFINTLSVVLTLSLINYILVSLCTFNEDKGEDRDWIGHFNCGCGIWGVSGMDCCWSTSSGEKPGLHHPCCPDIRSRIFYLCIRLVWELYAAHDSYWSYCVPGMTSIVPELPHACFLAKFTLVVSVIAWPHRL